ncbi:hypothetical protein M407DRAFT_243401, partial [Tulasnella calospora MUT 4182]
QLDGDHDALNTPSSSTVSTPKLRPPRTLGDIGFELSLQEAWYPVPIPPAVDLGHLAGVDRLDGSAHNNITKEIR